MTSFIMANPAACIGCRTCEIACALEHATEHAAFAPRLTVLRLDTLSVPVMCHQCENAPCVGACPVGAHGGRASGSRCRPLYWLPELRGGLSVWCDYRRGEQKSVGNNCEVRFVS